VDAGGNELALLLKAATFSADRHRHQRRKGVDASPYINHPLDVAHILASVGGVTDVTTLVAAILHDTIEDTDTTVDELETNFGREVRRLVEEVTDDKRLDRAERKRLQVEHAPNLSAAAKVIKLGDKISNVRDVIENPPSCWSMDRRDEYLDWAAQVVRGCRDASEPLARHFDELLQRGKAITRGG
jgi:guanosine-3',5'-bis(diphosphate) 3'-pyrophosphohydrolase